MTKGIAIMLYISSPEIGDDFHNQYLKAYNFPRTRYPKSNFYTDYHITIGYLKAVNLEDIENITNHISKHLVSRIDLEKISFKFDKLILLGSAHRQFVAALPSNYDEFCKYNKIVYDSLKSFNNNQYSFDHHTLPENYLAHINLYAHLGKEIPISSAKTIIESLETKLRGASIPFTKIRIY